MKCLILIMIVAVFVYSDCGMGKEFACSYNEEVRKVYEGVFYCDMLHEPRHEYVGCTNSVIIGAKFYGKMNAKGYPIGKIEVILPREDIVDIQKQCVSCPEWDPHCQKYDKDCIKKKEQAYIKEYLEDYLPKDWYEKSLFQRPYWSRIEMD